MWQQDRQSVAPFDFEGLRIRVLTPSNLSSGSIAEIEVPPGSRHRPARSTLSDKYYIGLDGTVSFMVGDKRVSLSSRQVLVIERNEWFTYYNDQKIEAHMLLIHVPPFELEREEIRDELPTTTRPES